MTPAVDRPPADPGGGTVQSGLQGTGQALAEAFDVALLDLDGVVYRGQDPVVHAAAALERARLLGMRLAFVTNNALRPPDEVARRIRAAGVSADAADVVTSAQAAARLLSEQFAAGSRVLVAGGAGLRQAVSERDLVPVAEASEAPVAVVSGYDPQITYARLAEACIAILGGATWVASNTDTTVPSERGLLPGAGAIVAFIAAATKVTPQVAGKPERALHEESISRSRARRPLVVGDRLDTDIEGANRAATPSLLVLTGVATISELISAAQQHRPTYLGDDLRSLLQPAPQVFVEAGRATCGAWTARVRGGQLHWELGEPAVDDDGLDAARAGLALYWRLIDEGHPPDGVKGNVPPRCGAFQAALNAAAG